MVHGSLCYLLILVGLSGAIQASAESKSIRMPIYERKLDAPAHSVLCINVGISQVPGHVGHSTVSLFELDKKNQKPGVFKSVKVESIGYWPKDPSEEHDLRYNYSEDNFLKFQNGYYPKDKAKTFCVKVTKSESKEMMDFYRAELAKDKDWSLKFNCNDISRLNFEKATGIHFKTRAVSMGFCSHPGTLLKNVEKYMSDKSPSEYFTYSTNKPHEVEMIKGIEAGPDSGKPAFTKEDAKARRHENWKDRRSRRPRGHFSPRRMGW